MLMRLNDRAVDMMEAPIQVARRVGLLLQVGQDSIPDAGSSPAIQAGRNGLPRTVLRGQVTPRRSRADQLQQAIEDTAVVLRRPTTSRALGREQRPQPLPLVVGKVSSVHTPESTHFDYC